MSSMLVRRLSPLAALTLVLGLSIATPAMAIGSTAGTITLTPAAGPYVYGDDVDVSVSAAEADLTGEVTVSIGGASGACTLEGGSPNSCTATVVLPGAGTNRTVSGSYPGDDVYDASTGATTVATAQVSISQLAYNITADAIEKTYGETYVPDNSEWAPDSGSTTVKSDGSSFDTVTAVTSLTDTPSGGDSDDIVGTYTLDVGSVQIKDGANNDVTSNYDIGTSSGTLQVIARPLEITADNDSTTYGDGYTAVDTAFTITDGSLAASDGTATDTLTLSMSMGDSPNTGEETYAPVGTYTITPGSALIKDGSNVDVTANYDITYVDGELSVDHRQLSITADNATKTYGNTFTPDNTAYTISSGSLASSRASTQDSLIVNITASDTPSGESAGDPVGTYALTPSASISDAMENDVTANYDITYVDGTLTIEALELAPADPWFTGQQRYITSSRTSTTAKVLLSATINADLPGDEETDNCGGASVTSGTVTFSDMDSGKILARDVPITEVGQNCEDGIASAFATLSSGTDFTQTYTILVTVGGSLEGSNYGNDHQSDLDLASMVVTVSQPLVSTAGMSSSGFLDYLVNTSLTNLGTEGTLTSDMLLGDLATYAASFTTASKTAKAKGRAELRIPAAEGGRFIVRTNAVTSVITSGGNVATVYAKANISYQSAECMSTACWVALDGNASLRLDVSESPQRIGFTILSSKNSALFFSNNWQKLSKTWVTVSQVPAGAITSVN